MASALPRESDPEPALHPDVHSQHSGATPTRHDTSKPAGRTESFEASLARELNTLDRAGLRRTLRAVDYRINAEVVIDGRKIADFSSNDYLGLAGDPRIAHTASQYLAGHGIGAAAARLISGNTPEHMELETALAQLKGTESALLFSSGYMANLGTISALAGKRDVIYSDQLNHASLLDAVKLSRAEVRVFPHLDVEAVRRMLIEDSGKFRRRLIVVDGVFSMDGEIFPLDKLVPVAREFDAWTYVDDAHATAVIGKSGRGTAEHCGVEGDIDVTMGTLGKSLGVAGAFIAGSKTLTDFLLHRARSFVFTTSSPPVLAAAVLEAIRIVREEPWRRERLWENAKRIRAGLKELGYPAPGEPDNYIVPVIIGDVNQTVAVGKSLLEAGFLVGAVRPPSVPMGTSRLRITVNAMHTDTQIEGLLASLKKVLL